MFGGAVLLALPGVVYTVLLVLIASGRLEGTTAFDPVVRDAFLLGFVAPFATVPAATLSLILWFGGRRVSLKIIATLFLAAAVCGLVFFKGQKF